MGTQNPIQAGVAVQTIGGAKKSAPLQLDPLGSLLTAQGATVSFNITAARLLRAAGPGRVCRVSVLVAGSAAGTVNDCATTGAAAVANQVGVIPAVAGTISIDMPCATGMVVVPGTGQTLAVSYM